MDLARDAYVDGTWVTSAKRFAVNDPFDGELIAEVADCDVTVVERAIAAAGSAFAAWRTRPAPERGVLLAKLAALMARDEARLAELCTRENGKALKESVGEVKYAASFIHWFAGEAERIYGETIPATRGDGRITMRSRRPQPGSPSRRSPVLAHHAARRSRPPVVVRSGASPRHPGRP